MQVAEEKGFTARESRVRHMALKAATALSVLLSSLLFFLAVPVFPWELMVLCAIALGALAYKTPTLAVMLMLILALPGYMYQLNSALPAGTSLPAPLFVIMSVLLLGGAIAACQTGAALGVATGAVAAILMLTPLHFLALPIIIGTILFRTKNVGVHATSTVFTFTVLYFPLLAINSGASPGGVVPIFEPVLLNTRPPISILGLNEISAALGQVMGTNGTGGARTYLANLGDYWPLSLGHRLLPLGLLFCILAGSGIVVTRGMFALFRWLKRRDVNHDFLTYAAPALSLLIGVLTFFLLASVLARPFDYVNTINVLFLLLGTVLVGGSGSLAEIWLKKRDLTLDMRDHLAELAKAIRTRTDFLIDRIRETKARCYRMDISAEEALVQICQQELEFAEQTITELSLTDLEHKIVRFQELQTNLNESVQESNGKIYQYYDEDRQRYNDSLILAKKYGFDFGETVQGPGFSQLTSMEYDEVLKLQINLNESYKNSTRLLAEGVKNLEERLCAEVDADFKRTGIRIASDYFAQERCAEAMQEFLVELGDIEHILQDTISGLDKEVLSILNSLKTILADILMPTATNLGDVNSVHYYQEVMNNIVKLDDPPIENPALPELMRIVSKVFEISEIIAALSSKLSEKIFELEKNILAKTPRGYNWGVDPQIQNRIAGVSRTFGKTSSPVGIHERLSLLKSGPAAVETAAYAVKDYSIAHELLINYTIIESIIEKTLQEEGVVSYDNLPVKRQYSHKYLELYCLKHPGEVLIEADTGRLTKPHESQPEIRPGSKNTNKTMSRK